MKTKAGIGLLVVCLLILAGLLVRPTPAFADDLAILKFSTMVGVPRTYTGNTNAIRGISGGGFPWVISTAEGKLTSSGKLNVDVTGLVIDPHDPAAITAGVAGKNPAPAFKAIVSCLSIDPSGAPSTVNISTSAFPATSDGNADIQTFVNLPHPCIAPIIFVTSPGGAWFAATGY